MDAVTGLRKGDLVQVMIGRARGKSGKIIRVDYKTARVTVEKLNMVKRHLKPSRTQPQGGMVEREAAIHWSNVRLLCGKCARPVRVRRTTTSNGTTARCCVKCGTAIGASA